MNDYLTTEFKKKTKKAIYRKKCKLETEEVVNTIEELSDYEFAAMKYVHVRPSYRDVCMAYKNPINILSSKNGNNIDQFFNFSAKQTFQTERKLYNLHVKFSNTVDDMVLRKRGIFISHLETLPDYFTEITNMRWLDKIIAEERESLSDAFTYFITDILFYAMAYCAGIAVIDRSLKYLTGMRDDYNEYAFCKNYCRLFGLDFSDRNSFRHLIHENQWLAFCNNFDYNKEFDVVMKEWDTTLKRGFLYTICLLSTEERDEIIYCYISSLNKEQREKLNKKKEQNIRDGKRKIYDLSNILFSSTDEFHKDLFNCYKNIIMENFTLEQAQRMTKQITETQVLNY